VVEASDQRGRITVIPQFAGSVEGLLPRDVYIYLPPGYDRDQGKRYPVLYMQDGQNCWDDPTEPFGHGGWCVNAAADAMIAAGRIRPFIAVGLASTPDRMSEYGPGPDICSNGGQAYIRHMADDVKPMIDGTYRTLRGPQDTAVMGSSMGGLISMQAALQNPETFGHAACLSPAFFITDAQGRTYGDLVRSVGKVPVRLYLDSGTAGPKQDGAPETRQMVTLLRTTGWRDGEDLLHFEDAGAAHNERAWRGRLEKPLLFLFGRQKGKVGGS
jgi:enterochelin esterase-like enzyme